MMVWAVLPFSKYVVAVDLNIGLLYVIAIVSVATLGLLMAGWSSNNKYSLLGAMRSVAQMLSYELPLVFSILGVVMLAGSINLSAVVEAQTRVWFIIPQFLGFIIFIISATAELNRLPFDLVEADSELTAGAFTEYSGMRWGIFFAAEYANIFAVSALATTLFLGGWHGPLLPPYVWFFIKTCTMMFFFIWMRWTFPRLRIDQLLNLSWKVLLPLSILNILLTGTAYFFFFL
jgi:NADH-quinone oxidoreductase subunit H